MLTKVIYIDPKGKRNVLWYGGACTPEEVKMRLQHMKELGFRIVRHYPVITFNDKRRRLK